MILCPPFKVDKDFQVVLAGSLLEETGHLESEGGC